MPANPYSVIPHPVDGSVWSAAPGVPGRLLRTERGSNPPETCIFEVYEPPYNNPRVPGVNGYTPRGIDIDRNGVVWTALASSCHLASFDRRKCAVLRGSTATGQHCPEGWRLYPMPGPWKGRGLWASNGTRAVWHSEGGKGTQSTITHFQLRPDRLAK